MGSPGGPSVWTLARVASVLPFLIRSGSSARPTARFLSPPKSSLRRALRGICAERSVTLVVIGLPVSADGTEGPGCVRARRIAADLLSRGLRVELQDESWSSRDAEDILRETGKNRRKSKEKVDAIAASLILSEFLREAPRP